MRHWQEDSPFLTSLGRMAFQKQKVAIEEWIKKIWYTYIMEYYSDINKNEIMPFAATEMKLEYHTYHK